MIQRMNEFFQKDIISIRDLDKQKLELIFDATEKIMKINPKERREIARGRTLGYLFYEPSTRTRLSFEAAIASIGGTSFGISDISSSSTQKGESLADTNKLAVIAPKSTINLINNYKLVEKRRVSLPNERREMLLLLH